MQQNVEMRDVPRTSVSTLSAILNQSTDCIKVISPDGSVQYMNPNGLCAMEIDDFQAIEGKRWSDLWPEESRNRIENALLAARDGATDRFQAYCPTAKGAPRWWDVSVCRIDDDEGTLTGVLSISRDVTEIVRAKLEAEEAAERIRGLQLQLIHMARNSAMGSMAATLAHELNQPLAAIANYACSAQVLMGQREGSKIDEALSAIVENSVRAGAIIKSVRAMTMDPSAEKDTLDLGQIVKDAVEFAVIGASAETSLKLALADGITVWANPAQVQQVLINLIRNAAEAVEGATQKEITVATRICNNEALFEIRDSGAGIAEHHREAIFDALHTPKSGRAGLGLSVSRTIVEAQGGRLWAYSAPEGGAAFCFTLPIKREASEAG